jgi:hypothetical protein
MDAGWSDVSPCVGDGVQAGAPGHAIRLPPPAGRQVKLCLPQRMLAEVVDDDGKGVPRVLPRITHGSHKYVFL